MNVHDKNAIRIYRIYTDNYIILILRIQLNKKFNCRLWMAKTAVEVKLHRRRIILYSLGLTLRIIIENQNLNRLSNTFHF